MLPGENQGRTSRKQGPTRAEQKAVWTVAETHQSGLGINEAIALDRPRMNVPPVCSRHKDPARGGPSEREHSVLVLQDLGVPCVDPALIHRPDYDAFVGAPGGKVCPGRRPLEGRDVVAVPCQFLMQRGNRPSAISAN